MLSALILGAGLVLLVIAADQFVTGAARISLALRVSPVVVGAIVIGFGTSAPEILTAILAAAEGSPELGAGSIAGSNIANLALIASVAALITPLAVRSSTLRREAPMATAAVLLFAVVLLVGLSVPAGVALLVLLVAAAVRIVRGAAQDDDVLGDEAREAAERDHRPIPEGLRTALGLAGTVAGAQLVVTGARDLALEVGLSEAFVGLTLVAVGTSLPELASAVQAARRGETDLIIGNVLGSNLFNSLAAGGALAIIAPGDIADDVGIYAIVVMAVTAVLAHVLLATGRRLGRREAVLLLVVYAALLPFLA